MMRCLILKIAMLWFAVPAAHAGAHDADIAVARATHKFDDTVSQLDAEGRDGGSVAYSSAIAEAYKEFAVAMPPVGELPMLDDESLSNIFRVLSTTVFYTNDVIYLPAMQSVAERIRQRDGLSASQVNRLHGAYMRTRMFAEADKLFRTQNPRAPDPTPAISQESGFDARGPAVIRLQKDQEKLLIANERLDSPMQIVVTIAPHCAPSQRALRDISSDRSLSAIFHQHALWLLPVDESLHVEYLRLYSDLEAVGNVGVAYNRKAWPMIDSWSTPIFYFLRNGQVVNTVRGWPQGGRLEELRRAIENVESSALRDP